MGARSIRNSCITPRATIYAARIGMTNKYAFDYACEDEYHEREMTLADAKTMTLPLPDNFRHKSLPMDYYYPPHWNDVRFNHRQQNFDRRMFLHDNMAISYNM